MFARMPNEHITTTTMKAAAMNDKKKISKANKQKIYLNYAFLWPFKYKYFMKLYVMCMC